MIKKLLNFFNKKEVPSLKFVCLIPEIVKTTPILPASKVNYSWFRTATEYFKKQKDAMPAGVAFRHIARCPGIISISKNGWIQQSYQDITIKTNGDGDSFEWSTPINQSSLSTGHEWNYDYVAHHDIQTIAPYNSLKPNTLKTVIKIQSPWIVYIPPGYNLLCLPIPYPDDNRFTAAIGILDGDQGPNFLNIQLYWHCLNSAETIPAGTPLVQYFLVKKEKINDIIEAYSQDTIDDLRLRRMTLDSQFLPSYAKLKNTF